MEPFRRRRKQVEDILRQHLYFESDTETLFGWLHTSRSSADGRSAVVICNPVGVEYMSGHRSIRRLADRLAEQGVPALRFDYRNTGDSSGGEFHTISVTQIVADIQSAMQTLRELSGISRVSLIGIGLGATFAAIAAEQYDVAHLILWNPTVSGRRFVREQRLLSEVVHTNGAGNPEAIDSAGIFLTPDLQKQFAKIDLTQLDWQKAEAVLLISRSDMNSHQKLATVLETRCTGFQMVALPGYKEMMDQPTETVVPIHAFDYICDWLDKRDVAVQAFAKTAAVIEAQECRQMEIVDESSSLQLREVPAHFGRRQQLFGIATEPLDATRRGKCAFVFLNCGSEHHAGPHRLYTKLARRIAGLGNLAFRFDIEGIGDSVSIGNNEENNAYSRSAMDDVNQALNFLAGEYGCDEFILSGICAGAYHSFKACAELLHHNIREANLVNPLVFEWNYDDPDDHLRYEIHTYQSAIRSGRNWRRLVSGDINYRRLLRSFFRHSAEGIRRRVTDLKNLVIRSTPKGLPGDLRTLKKLRRPLTLILSEGDPGLKIMRLQARRETRSGLQNGQISVHHLERSNHGLSKKHMQDRLLSTLVNKYSVVSDVEITPAASGQNPASEFA